MDFNKIKLVIWDLDDTFWDGTLSEEEVTPKQENIELVRLFTDIGIINSINSKNDLEPVEKKLKEFGVREHFVFLSVNWSAKGQRIKDQIEAMQLRAPNVLFIDDNHLNIEEVKFYNPDIMTALPEELSSILEWAKNSPKKDTKHKRLNQYKILEKKFSEKIQSSSNEEFLYNSDIRVVIHKDCMNQIDRIHDMILRTNQLNFTKKRISKNELIDILNDDSYDAGYVNVTDRFGDYGIIGFFIYKDHELQHFLFSCRTLGMGIEQYIYAQLNYPRIIISGEVISALTPDMTPAWINQEQESSSSNKMVANGENIKILFKGPCDLEQIFSYIEETDKIEQEFTYINQETGVSIEQHNHTCHILQSITLEQERKDKLINELPFSDKDMFSDKMFKEKYDVVFLSMLTDGNLGVYQRKQSGELIAFGEYYYPLTEQENWNDYVNGNIFTANCEFTIETLREFSDNYNYIGRLPVQQMIENLRFIRENLHPNCLMVLMIGSETPYEENKKPAYEGRHIINKDINSAIKEFKKVHDNIEIIDFNNYIKGQGSFYNNINHFIKPVYYSLAKDIIKLINNKTNFILGQESKLKLMLDYSKQIAKKVLNKA
jgi:FkbH-like protein